VDALTVDALIVDTVPPAGSEAAPSVRSTRTDRPAWCPEDIVDEWGAGSFPASDPPANW
jgi:hypothetical protein